MSLDPDEFEVIFRSPPSYCGEWVSGSTSSQNKIRPRKGGSPRGRASGGIGAPIASTILPNGLL